MTPEKKLVPVVKYQLYKPKDGDGYTWRRVRRGEWEKVFSGMPEGIFPPEATLSIEVHEQGQRSKGSQAAHIAEKYED